MPRHIFLFPDAQQASSVIVPKRTVRTRQPVVPAIDWSHPLARHLQGAWFGKWWASRLGSHASDINDFYSSFVPTNRGAGVYNNTTSQGGVITAPAIAPFGKGCTVLAWVDSTASTPNFATLFSIPWSDTWASPYVSVLFRQANDDRTALELFIGNGAGAYTLGDTPTGSYPTFVGAPPRCYWVTYDGSYWAVFGYDNIRVADVPITSGSGGGVISYNSEKPMKFFGAPVPSTGEGWNGVGTGGMFLSTVLDVESVMSLAMNPSQVFEPLRSFTFIPGAAAAAADIFFGQVCL